jgi:DNA-binding GntR family transcriptional regulator
MTTLLEPIVVDAQTLTDKVYESVREAIVSRRIEPGARITENQISSQLGVSKTPAREALVKLAHVGLVEPAESRGVRVVAPSRRLLIEGYQVRAALEAQAVRLASERRSDSDLATLQRLAQESLAAAVDHDGTQFRRVNPGLHRTIARCSGNERLAALVSESIDLVAALRARDLPVPDTSELCGRQHVAIVSAIADRAATRAAQLVREHLATVLQSILDSHDAHAVATGQG